MLYPALQGSMQHDPLPLPACMRSVTTDDGVFHYNPALTSAHQIVAAAAVGRLNYLLGLGPYSKDDILKRVVNGELPIAVVELARDGTEVKAAWGTHLTAATQAKSLEASKTPGHFVFITSPLHVLMLREATLATTRD